MDSNQKRKDTKKMRGAASAINTPIPLNSCAPPTEPLETIIPGASAAATTAYNLFVEACKLQPSGAAGAQQLSRTQSQALRRAWKEFTKLNLWDDSAENVVKSRSVYIHTATHLAHCIFTGETSPPRMPLSGMATSAATHYLSAGFKDSEEGLPTTILPGLQESLAATIRDFVTQRLSAATLDQGFTASSAAVSALLSALEVAPLAKLFAPHAGAVLAFIDGFLQRYPLRSGAEHEAVVASSNALKAFVDAAARMPHELAPLIPGGSGAVAMAALTYMGDRSLTKDFLSASGIAFATIAAARALRANGETEDDADLQAIASMLACGLLSNVGNGTAVKMSKESVEEALSVVFGSEEERNAALNGMGALGALAILRGLTVSKFVSEALPGLLTEGFMPMGGRRGDEVTLICDALLPAAVAACEAATEQYPLFFSLQTLDECLKMLDGALRMRCIGIRYKARERVTEFLKTRTVEVVWKHQGSTVPAICAQLRNVFSSILELFEICVPEGSEGWDAFLTSVAARLLALSWRTKGKYAPLTVLLRLVPASRMIEIEPNLFDGIVDAMSCHVVHSAAHNFFVALVDSLLHQNKQKKNEEEEKEGSKSGDNQEEEEKEEVKQFVKRLVRAIVARASPETSWRILVEDAASALLRVLPHALGLLIACAAAEETGDGFTDSARLLFLLCVLNYARKSDIVPDPAEFRELVRKNAGEEYQSLVRRGLAHPDEAVFIESLELICISPRVTDVPAEDDLVALREFIISNSAHSTLNSRQKMFGPLCKFFDRVRAALHRYTAAKDAASSQPPPEKKVQQHNAAENNGEKAKSSKRKRKDDNAATAATAVVTEEVKNKLVEFLNWTADELTALMYPGASQDRVMFALTAYKALCSVSKELKRLGVDILTAAHAESLLSCMWLTMDKARQLTHEIFTTWCDSARNVDGLPGFNDAASVEGAIRWGLRLAHSPKMYQSDAGGRMLSFVLSRLLSDTVWKARLAVTPATEASTNPVPVAVTVTKLEQPNKFLDAAYDFVRDLTKVLVAQTEVAKKDILLASTKCPMHGILAAIRYCIRQIPFADIAKEGVAAEEKKRWHSLLTEAMHAARGAYKVVLPIVADLAPEGYDPSNKDSAEGASEEGCGKAAKDLSAQIGEKISMIQAVQMPPMEQISATDFDDEDNDACGDAMVSGDEISGPSTQLIMVCSWLTIKEVSFFLAAVYDVVPLPQADSELESGLVTLQDVRETGNTFLEMLLSTRHKGAIEKGYEGFRSLCVHVLKSKSAAVRALANEWIRATIGILYDPVSQQITRRSAGIPYCLLAVLNADLTGSRLSCAMLDATMQELLELSAGTKGYSAQVHAFNIVGSFVNQKAVSVHVDAYLDRILVRILEGYTSPDWSVRNSATIAFNIVVKRRVATSNFAEFFARFPQLYKHTLAHIGAMCQTGSSDKVQSSLFAVLTLLSRLHPSVSLAASVAAATAASTSQEKEEEGGESAGEGGFVPEPFIPYVRSCASQPTFKIREAAAFALVPLIRPENLAATCLDLCNSLPVHGEKGPSSNTVHGTLLQLEKLLKHGLASLGPSIVTKELIASLAARLWLAASPCSAIGLIMTKVLRALLSVLPSIDSAVWAQGLCAARGALELHMARVYDGTRPMDALRAEAAADLCVTAALSDPAFYESATGESAVDLIERALSVTATEGKGGDLYEIRAACAHALRDHLRSAKGHALPAGIDACRVRAALYKRLLPGDECEKHRYCIKLILETLPLIAAAAASDSAETLAQLWARSEELMENDLLRPAGLVFLGACARKWPGGEPPRWAALAAACRRCSEPSAVISDRLAVVEALRLVLANAEVVDSVANDAWECLITLVQDDSFDVRQAAGEVISGLLHLKSIVSPPLALEYAVKACAGLNGAKLVDASKDTAMDSDAFIESLGKSHLFEVEPDNGYIEEATLLQLQQKAQGAAAVAAALEGLAATVESLKKVFDQAQKRSNGWPRWLTYDRAIFVPLYRGCLNAYAAVKAATEGQMHVEVSEAEKKMISEIVAKLEEMPLHPILAQLVSRLAKVANKDAEPKLVTAGNFGNIDATSFLMFQV